MKRFLTALLTVCMLCSLLPPFVMAEEILTESLDEVLEESAEAEELILDEIFPEGIPEEFPDDPEKEIPDPAEQIIEEIETENNETEEISSELAGAVVIDGTNFPGEAFRAYVTRFDTNGDGSLSSAEIAVVEEIDCQGERMESLAGVEHFTALTYLDCDGNLLSSLNVSRNVKLKTLICKNNNLTVLDVSKNTALETLYCYSNQLTALDLTHNSALQSLDCYDNQLKSLDVSKNPALKELWCDSNLLTRLDISNNTMLCWLACNGNNISSLDISNCPSLKVAYSKGEKERDGDVIYYRYGDPMKDYRALTVDSKTKVTANSTAPTSTPAPTPTPKPTPTPTPAPKPTPAPTPLPSPSPDADLVSGYVKRCYSVILNREGDAEGISYWTNALKSGVAAGADIVILFCNSAEFRSKNLPNREVVTILYNAMLGRSPDAGGLNYWADLFDKGVSCNLIISGFVGSAEFAGICSQYGILPGTVALENRDQNPSVTAFVNRCYQVALGRNGDADGLNGWTGNLLSKAMSAQEVSYAFLFSAEFESLKTNNGEFVNRLYRLYMNREPDSAGKSGWVSQLNQGASRMSVAKGFANSAEFENIVRSYGLDFAHENTSFGVISANAPITRENILTLLDAYDPDGAFIIRNSSAETLMQWFGGATELGAGAYSSMNTAVHEQCHSFANTPHNYSEYIYTGNGNYIVVPYTETFPSKEMASSIPETLRTFRFGTYVDTDENSVPGMDPNLEGTQQYGIYGLLNEFTAYCWGCNNDVALQDYLTENGMDVWRKPNTLGSYIEFRYYILHYMLYAREHHPDIYQGILNNVEFRTAFSTVDALFQSIHEKNVDIYRHHYPYSVPLDQSYDRLKNEMAKPEYVNMTNLLKP